MTTDQKKHRAQVILQCAHAIAEYYGTTAEKLLSPKAYRLKAIQDARTVFAYHLHDCGISIASIAGMFKRSIYATEEKARYGRLFLMGSDRAMIETLPRIPTTLSITKV